LLIDISPLVTLKSGIKAVEVNSNEIREAFLHFFEEKGHRRIPSSSLVPESDPTLLLTTAGMVQFKRYFTGEALPLHPRLASCQKCFRTTDIDSVGDSKHLTFFEMLGNFSVGDYFKREAIEWAWEFVTQRLGLPQERLWVTIFLDDDEAFDYWREVGVPEERILRFGEEDNFWGPAGETGPCGPCSELHYDLGEGIGCGRSDCGPNCECGRFIEIWNLVFTQYDQQRDGKRLPLPKPNIDTGMGLERTAVAMQGKTTVYDTDLFAPLIEHVANLAGKSYGEDEATDRAMRIVAEHARAATFLACDGVTPSNEGRGYVLRRVVRRAALFGGKLGLEERFLEDIAEEVIKKMEHVYPELTRYYAHILTVIDEEEERFHDTLGFALNLFDVLLRGYESEGEKTISGKDAFYFSDTLGLPREVQAEVAEEGGFEVDWEGFEEELDKQRERARAAHKSKLGEIAKAPAYTGGGLPFIEFVGEDCHKLKHRSVVLQLAIKGDWKTRLFEGDEGEVVLEETPFYGEMGGQVGDTGEIRGPKGRFFVEDTIRPWPELTIHWGKVIEGYISLKDTVTAEVGKARRLDIARNHTATHLLQAALREVLGDHVRQSGSLVAPDRLRFDFTHPKALTKKELSQIQHLVNEKIRHNLPVKDRTTSRSEAIAQGALAFFEEKYEEDVRVLEIGKPPISIELCGGTHVRTTGEIGFFLIVGKSSIGAGMRRIEAVTGRDAEEFIEGQRAIIEEAAEELKAAPSEIISQISTLHAEIDAERKKASALERELLKNRVDSLLNKAESVNGIPVLVAKVSASNLEALRQMGDLIKQRLSSILVVLGAVYNDQANFVAMLTPDLVKRGLRADQIVKQVAEVTGGSGGGRAELGQAGGKDKDRLDEALELVRDLVAKHGNTGA
jgi:alanyl-tRNA synthetase